MGLDPSKTKRIVFHEITKPAIEAAVKNPRTVDMKLVEAQQARQILDRLVGFELSPVVWQKVPGGKSAGRVQSPAVRLLVDREREIANFEASSDYKVSATFHHTDETFDAELDHRLPDEKTAEQFLQSLVGASYSVSDIETNPGSRSPSAPFTTSTLQQEANSRLGFGSKATMASAQRLYQAGKITYMRTDSITLSGQAMASAAAYIKQHFGDSYSQVRNFKTKAKGAQEAHEAIRPTDISAEVASSDEYDQKLYELIRRRTLASQMASARLEKTTATILASTANSSNKHVFEAKGEVIVFDGFLKIYGRRKEDELLPPLTAGDTLEFVTAKARQTFARPPARYTEGSLVRELEKLGIGRPSTYATILGTIQTRGYAEKGDSEGNPRDVIEFNFDGKTVTKAVETENSGSTKGKLVPTSSGELIASFLTDHFTQIVDYGFTADVEKKFDDIADNKLPRNDMLKSFYDPFHKLIVGSKSIDRATVAQARTVGVDPKTGKTIYARIGRFGPLLQLGESDSKDEKPQFAPLPKTVRLDDVTLEQALHAFELPRIVGQTEDGQDIKANVGRFGPYIQVGKLFVSIKPLDPREITHAEALNLYAEKLKSEAEKNVADFGGGLKVLRGRYGPYVTDGKRNAKIPKDVKPEDVTEDQAKKLIAEAPAKTAKRPRRRSKKSK